MVASLYLGRRRRGILDLGADRFRRRDEKSFVRPELLRLVKQGINRSANKADFALAA